MNDSVSEASSQTPVVPRNVSLSVQALESVPASFFLPVVCFIVIAVFDLRSTSSLEKVKRPKCERRSVRQTIPLVPSDPN